MSAKTIKGPVLFTVAKLPTERRWCTGCRHLDYWAHEPLYRGSDEARCLKYDKPLKDALKGDEQTQPEAKMLPYCGGADLSIVEFD